MLTNSDHMSTAYEMRGGRSVSSGARNKGVPMPVYQDFALLFLNQSFTRR